MELTSATKKILACLFGIAFCIAFFFLVPNEELTCSKSKNICTYKETTVITNRVRLEKNINISDIKNAEIVETIERRTSSKSQTKYKKMYRIHINTVNANEPIFASSSARQTGDLEKINNFLHSAQQELKIVKDQLLIRIFIIFLLVMCVYAMIKRD